MIRLIILLCFCILVSCNFQSSTEENDAKIETTVQPRNNKTSYLKKLKGYLKKNEFALDIIKEVEINEFPNKLAYRKNLLSSNSISNSHIVYEKWYYDNYKVDIWVLEPKDIKTQVQIVNRIDSICQNTLPYLTSFRKKFKAHKVQDDKLVLIKHNIYDIDKSAHLEALFEFINKEYECW